MDAYTLNNNTIVISRNFTVIPMLQLPACTLSTSLFVGLYPNDGLNLIGNVTYKLDNYAHTNGDVVLMTIILETVVFNLLLLQISQNIASLIQYKQRSLLQHLL